jgi:hypothetical protein
MTDDRVWPDHPLDPDSTPLERALAAHRHGLMPDTALNTDEQQLIDDLLPWLEAFQDATEQASADASAASAPQTSPEPVLADDPVALMLGLVPDPASVVGGPKLKQARQRAGLKLPQLSDRLRTRGWNVTTGECLRWEMVPAALPPALVTAIADELNVSDTALLATHDGGNELNDLLDDARISAFLSDWAAEIAVEPGTLRGRTASMLASGAHRNRTAGSVEALLGVLRTMRSIPNFLDKP